MPDDLIRLIAVAQGSQVAALLGELGIGERFEFESIELSHPVYAAVNVLCRESDGETHLVELMIPHRDVILIALKVPRKALGFHVANT
jgi:hypothetical protein